MSTGLYSFVGNDEVSVIPTPQGKTKTLDTVRNNISVLANDPDLQFQMLANTKYRIKAIVFYDTLAAADFKFGYSGPASATLIRIARHLIVPGTSIFGGILVDTTYATNLAIPGASGNGGFISFEGIIHNGPNTGTFAFQWAQNTATIGDTTVRSGSYLEFHGF